VVNLAVDEATTQIEGVGLRVHETDKDSTQTPGTVLAQSPAANASVPEGSTVTLTVAREPQDVKVPDVTGEPADQAVNDISNANLSPTTVSKAVTDPAQDGVVIKQSPSGGKKAKRGDKVTLTIGRLTTTTTPTTPAPGGQTPTTTTTTPGQ